MEDNFWDLGDGTSAADVGDSYEIEGGGNLDPIPNGSVVLAMIDDVKWDGDVGQEHIKIQWGVMSPDEFKNRKVFQKMWVGPDLDPRAKDTEKAKKKQAKAKKMLVVIDKNAGGGLMRLGRKPETDDLMTHLAGKPMTIGCMVWEMPDSDNPGETVSGNWINKVGPASAPTKVGSTPVRKSSPPGGQHSPGVADDDEIPF